VGTKFRRFDFEISLAFDVRKAQEFFNFFYEAHCNVDTIINN
jgi:hypothetical protein